MQMDSFSRSYIVKNLLMCSEIAAKKTFTKTIIDFNFVWYELSSHKESIF